MTLRKLLYMLLQQDTCENECKTGHNVNFLTGLFSTVTTSSILNYVDS